MASSQARLRQEILKYLEEHNTLTLATFQDGMPWAAALFYANDGFTLYFLSATNTRHVESLTRNPQVAATVNEDYHDWTKIKGIQLEGRAEPVTSEEELGRAVEVYVTKYPFVRHYIRFMMSPFPKVVALLDKLAKKLPWAPEFTATPARFYRIVPTRLWFTDNEKGLGHRDELAL